MKKVVVISLGGSLIIPDKINIHFLKEFRKTIRKNERHYKFVIVCGGGYTARNYINGLNDVAHLEYFQGLLGIASTRLNARFMSYFFGKEANEGIPMDMIHVQNLLKKNNIVFCGALRYAENETSDATAAKLTRYFETVFINLTDVAGLYNKDPKKFKNAEFIPEISHKNFYEMTRKINFKPGQHFVLDQEAAVIIKKYNIKTFILGKDLKQFDNLLNGKHFIGTIIED